MRIRGGTLLLLVVVVAVVVVVGAVVNQVVVVVVAKNIPCRLHFSCALEYFILGRRQQGHMGGPVVAVQVISILINYTHSYSYVLLLCLPSNSCTEN